MRELVTVIIPILGAQINPTEEKLLHHALNMLSKHPIIFVAGENSDLSVVREHAADIDVIRFPQRYFESRQHLSQLLLMPDFYDHFNWCEFLLIHELNSWVLRDELFYWCKQGYDYLKCRSLLSDPGILKRLTGLTDDEKRVYGEGYTNNGLYLCRIDRMSGTLKSKTKTARKYRHDTNIPYADSVFWDLEANRFWPYLRKPTGMVLKHFAKNGVYSDTEKNLPFALTGISGNNIHDVPYFKNLPETE